MKDEKVKIKLKESNDMNKNNKLDNQSMMSIENNLISRKKVKIKTLRRLNLDLPDDLLKYDNESQIASNKPQSKNQIIESYGELTHRSMFFPKPKKVENTKKISSNHIENLKEIKNKLNFERDTNKEIIFDKKNENDNFSNKDEVKNDKNNNNEKEKSEGEKKTKEEIGKNDEEKNYKEKESDIVNESLGDIESKKEMSKDNKGGNINDEEKNSANIKYEESEKFESKNKSNKEENIEDNKEEDKREENKEQEHNNSENK